MNAEPHSTSIPAGNTVIDNDTLAHLVLSSFRYGLGRMTYITGMCADWLIKYWHLMPPAWKRQIHADIERAIDHKYAGWECDVEQWKRVLKLPLE